MSAELAQPAGSTAGPRLTGLPAISIDIETNPADGQRIFAIGVVRSDSGASVSLATGRLRPQEVTQRIDDLTTGARLLVGHNLRRHDLPELLRQYPQIKALQLPLLDTLELSAIAFPTNPYHRLVKGYKLLSDSKNNPVKDARLTLDLLQDEIAALREIHTADPAWTSLLHFLLGSDAPLNELLEDIRAAPCPSTAAAATSVLQRFKSMCCHTRLSQLVGPGVMPDFEDGLAVALALGWVRVSGGNSVLPIWVHKAMPRARSLIGELREQNCSHPECAYCKLQHHPESLLQAHFHLQAFRGHPTAPDGSSLQRAIVVSGLERNSLLAVLPTGGGKSICYQLPALVHYARAGQLTVIVSPLQSLMKDQVDNLIAAGVHCAVTINGLLTPLERRAALDKIRLGDAGMVLVSPEQFRSRTFTDAIRHREIATWVFDEAHCLSKWGHDFRTDYLYVSRFIREHVSEGPAPVACFTATAKPDVIDDLCAHFRDGLAIELERLLGGHERPNLAYLVVPVVRADKAQRIVELLRHELAGGGAAVIFCATRKAAQTTAELVTAAGTVCGCFHGGLLPEQKKDVQQRFMLGELAVIAATNAFGMGVDKPDIRVVIHANIPGSLENYLQEAGRAGRDGDAARCVLLFDAEDVEAQFRLSARSQLVPRDFTGLLKAIRTRVQRFKNPEIVVSATELLADSEGTAIDIEAPDASTKVTTAVAWLERSGFLQRNENSTRVFPASLRVASLAEALQRIEAAALPARQAGTYAAVATALFRNLSPAGISTDELMLEAGIPAQECFRVLHQLETLGVLVNDLGLSVRLSEGVRGASDLAFEQLDRLERTLLALMSELAPDADAEDAAQHLSIRPLCTELRRRMGLPAGDTRIAPLAVRNCLRSLAENFGSGTEKRGLLQIRGAGPDSLRVVLKRSWGQIRAICELRRAAAQAVLARLLANLPPGTREGSLIVECRARELLDALEGDLELRARLRDPALALEHALLYLHDNGVLELDKGRSVFRSAMTLLTHPTNLKRRFTKDDFAPLQEHYRERTLQTHVMHEYARLGTDDPLRAQQLVDAYFRWSRRSFVREFFKGRAELLELATTDESFRRIVDDLDHPVQQALVEAPEHGNHLVLAGPGSGKTRVIVHRIAYLLRVRRIAPQRIIALAFNRSAAVELRRRLLALVGPEARRVTVLTYHAMALRLTGTSLAAADRDGAPVNFDVLLDDAIDLLAGKAGAITDADEARDRLLQGYQYIFVDEYQDIDERQYALVSALAGRTQADPDSRLSVMAVGDDDQNIYGFKGSSVEFIRRFQADYGGEVTYLVENFRSTQHIISAANHVIQRAADRMKVDQPIRIDSKRAADPPGGRWSGIDPGQRRVRLITAPADANRQAQLVFTEIARIRAVDPGTPLGGIAVLARTHEALVPLRALCELEGLRYELSNPGSRESRVRLTSTREGRRTVDLLASRRSRLRSTSALRRWLQRKSGAQPGNPFWEDLRSAVDEFADGSEAERVPGAELLDALYEADEEARRHHQPATLKLMTAHAAKGQEFDHVVIMDCADWWRSAEDERRLLYVAMTRARQSLTLMRAEGGRNPYLVDLGTVAGVVDGLPAARPAHRPDIDVRYEVLGPKDVDIGFAGRRSHGDPVHAAIGGLCAGDTFVIDGRSMKSGSGLVVGQLAARTSLDGKGPFLAKVTAIMVRSREQTAAQYVDAVRVGQWEVVLAELVMSKETSLGGAGLGDGSGVTSDQGSRLRRHL